jgi:peptide/nickel transport system ATP-binding protein
VSQAPPGDVTLQVDRLSVSYRTPRGPLRAVRDVSFSIRPGQTFGLIGESGSGKSTVAYAIMNYLQNGRVEDGRILFRGRDLLGMRRAELNRIRGSAISMVYQEPQSALNPSITVGEQVAESLRHHRRLSGRAARERVEELLTRVNMPNPSAIAARYPHQLSGGQQQRVVIAMALAGDPDLLVMDEPTTGLDVTTEARILDLVAELKGRVSASILYISHSLGVIARVCDEVGVMYAGRLVETGSVRDIFRAPRHPYTVGLLASLPRLGAGKANGRLQAIPGGLPDLTTLPAGCVFEPRCGYARAQCAAAEPELLLVGEGHASRCHFWDEVRPLAPVVEAKPEPNGSATTAVGAPLAAPEAVPSDPATPMAEAGAASSAPTNGGSRPTRGDRPLLEIVDLTKYYAEGGGLLSFGPKGEVKAVDGIGLELQPGETLAVVGESGCGKTTLSRCVVGLVAPTDGTLSFEGAELDGLARQRTRDLRRQVQVIFQNPDATLNPRRTVLEAVGRPLELFGLASGGGLRERAAALLRTVRLDERYLDRYPKQLSGGEKQRVSIARAFAAEPRLIVCDEPVSALDVSVQAAVLNLLGDLQREHDTSYLFISHDLSVVQYVSDRIAIVYLGKVMELGTSEQVFAPQYHPYTEALLSAVPIPDPEVEHEHIRLEGPVPNPANPPSGCVFRTRCPRLLGPICEQETPPLRRAAAGHTIACHIPLEELAALAPIRGSGTR